MTTTVAYDDVAGLAGTDLGWTEWLEVTQDRVNRFAGATDDHQWIHVDPERAAKGPFASFVHFPLCGGTPPDVAWESLELYANEVLPRLA